MAKLPRPFNKWTTYNGHSGIDYPVPVGTPIRASGTGRISAQANNARGGYQRWVVYDDGRCMEYSHLRDFNGPPVGTRVRVGDVIGYSGNTGYSTGPHLHNGVEEPVGTLRYPPAYWERVDQGLTGYVGAPSTAGEALQANQRLTGPNGANGRNDPSTNGPITQTLGPGIVANMDGWINGQVVNGNGVWYHGAVSGDWFWSGGFTSQSKIGLTDMNKLALGPKQRLTVSASNGRALPSMTAPIHQTLDAGVVGDFDAWTHGDMVEDEDRWIRGAHSGDWFWLKAFEPRNVDNLTEVKLSPPPTPERPAYTFEAFGPSITEVIPANWMNFENEYSVPDPTKRVGIAADQSHVVLHDFGTHRQDTYEGTIAWFQNAQASTSAHMVISGEHRTQMVDLHHRAWHAGPKGNGYIGIEIDPVVGYRGTDPVYLEHRRQTIASVNLVLSDLRRYYGKDVLIYHEHNEFMTTSCGDDIFFEDYPQTPPVEPEPATVEVPRAALHAAIAGLDQIAEAATNLSDQIKTLLGDT